MPKSITFSARMRCVQRVDQRHQLGAFGLGGQHAQQPLAGPAVALVAARRQRVHQPFQLDVGVAQLRRCRRGVRPAGPASRSTIAVTAAGVLSVSSALGVLAHHAKRQLPQLGFAEQPGVGLDRASSRPCSRSSVPGERVVGADGGRVVGHVRDPGHRERGRRPPAAPAGCGPGAAAGPRPCG